MVAERRGVTGEVRPPAVDGTAGREEEQAAGGATTEEPEGGADAGAALTDSEKITDEENSISIHSAILFDAFLCDIFTRFFTRFFRVMCSPCCSVFCFFLSGSVSPFLIFKKDSFRVLSLPQPNKLNWIVQVRMQSLKKRSNSAVPITTATLLPSFFLKIYKLFSLPVSCARKTTSTYLFVI